MQTLISEPKTQRGIQRKNYLKIYRKKNRQKLNEYNAKWRKQNPAKWAQYMIDYYSKMLATLTAEGKE